MPDWKRMSKRSRAAALDFFHVPHGIKPGKPRVLVDHADLEKHVVRAISELLAVHPKVLIAWRQNSGGASYEHSSGKHKPIFFYSILTGQPVTIPDFYGILRTGKPFCIEAKRPSWKAPRDDREMRQALFISLIQNVGGIGGFCRSAEEANALLAQ